MCMYMYVPRSPVEAGSPPSGLTCRGCKTLEPVVPSAQSVAPALLTHTTSTVCVCVCVCVCVYVHVFYTHTHMQLKHKYIFTHTL